MYVSVCMYAYMQSEMERLKVEKIEPMRSAILTWSRQLSGAVQVRHGEIHTYIRTYTMTMLFQVLPGQPGAEHLNRRVQLGKYIRERQDR